MFIIHEYGEVFSDIEEQIEFSASPLFGPEAGGTKVSVRYRFFPNEDRAAFPRVDVFLGGEQIQNVIIQCVTFRNVPL